MSTACSSRPLVFILIVSLTTLSCVSKPTVRKPDYSAPEGTWYAYYYDQFSTYGVDSDKIDTPGPDASEGQLRAYNKALADCEGKKRSAEGADFFLEELVVITLVAGIVWLTERI